MISDFHLHTSFSWDSDTEPERQIEQAIQLGMETLCITDHLDMDFPGGEFQLDTPAYVERILQLREKYRGRIDLRLGVELGLQRHLGERIAAYAQAYPFDYVIGSMHLLKGQDPYDREIFAGRRDGEVYREYFEATLENLRVCRGIQSLGHLDYVVRYGKNQGMEYSYGAFADIIDEILKLLVERQIALEINTGGLKYGLGYPNPHPDVLRRYRELGGELVIVGSDAHVPQYVGYRFGEAEELLKASGFAYRAEFCQKKPVWIKIK